MTTAAASVFFIYTILMANSETSPKIFLKFGQVQVQGDLGRFSELEKKLSTSFNVLNFQRSIVGGFLAGWGTVALCIGRAAGASREEKRRLEQVTSRTRRNLRQS